MLHFRPFPGKSLDSIFFKNSKTSFLGHFRPFSVKFSHSNHFKSQKNSFLVILGNSYKKNRKKILKKNPDFFRTCGFRQKFRKHIALRLKTFPEKSLEPIFLKK